MRQVDMFSGQTRRTIMEQVTFNEVGRIIENCTQKEKLQIATWIVLTCLNDQQEGMTASDSYLDVVTRHCGDILQAARGRLASYGNKETMKKP
jgi:hypothetical protein